MWLYTGVWSWKKDDNYIEERHVTVYWFVEIKTCDSMPDYRCALEREGMRVCTGVMWKERKGMQLLYWCNVEKRKGMYVLVWCGKRGKACGFILA